MMAIIHVLSAWKNSTYRTETSNHVLVDTKFVHSAGITSAATSMDCVRPVGVPILMSPSGNHRPLKSNMNMLGFANYRLKQEQLRTAKKKDKKHHQPELPTVMRKSEPADSRKHLQGMRVTQKNLVYVIGLSLKLITDEALALLRGNEYFGQYGKIQKIMINKRKDIPPLRGSTFDKSGSS